MGEQNKSGNSFLGLVFIIVIIILITRLFSCGKNDEKVDEPSSVNTNKAIVTITTADENTRSDTDQSINIDSEDKKYTDISQFAPTEFDYLQGFINNNGIPVFQFDKQNKVSAALKQFSEDEASGIQPIFLEKEANLLSADSYKRTLYEDEYYYRGTLLDDRPEGIGMLIKTCYYNFDPFYIIKYIGEFHKGVPSGYGMDFHEPTEEEHVELDYLYGDEFPNYISNILNYLIYNGEFKDGKYSGKGNYYSYPNPFKAYDPMDNIDLFTDITSPNELNIFIGDWSKGSKNGKFLIYGNGFLRYQGIMKADEMNGTGALFFAGTNTVQYQGEFKNGSYNGDGTLYDESGNIIYQGRFKNGDIK